MARTSVPPGDSEFGGGSGLIDPVERAARNVTPAQELMEIYATNPARNDENPAEVTLERPQ